VLYTLMKYVLLGPLLRLFFPCKVIGAEYIPGEGGAILDGTMPFTRAGHEGEGIDE